MGIHQLSLCALNRPLSLSACLWETALGCHRTIKYTQNGSDNYLMTPKCLSILVQNIETIQKNKLIVWTLKQPHIENICLSSECVLDVSNEQKCIREDRFTN